MKKSAGGGAMIVRGSKMAKDKAIMDFSLDITAAGAVAEGQISLNPMGGIGVGGVTRPLTVSGLRWNFDYGRTVGGAWNHRFKWCIWVRRKAQAVPTIPVVASGSILDAFSSIDENNILVWGVGVTPAQAETIEFEGATKTQRKMAVGDQLVLSWSLNTSGGAVDTGRFYGCLQTFYKS